MFFIDQKITNSDNVVKIIKNDVEESKKKGFNVSNNQG